MKFIKKIQIEYLKTRHTLYNIYQMSCILGIVFVVAGTFFLYKNKTEIERIRLSYDIIAVMLPLLASISIALMLRQEEQVGNLFGMLFVENRRKVVWSKIFYSWGLGNIGFVLGGLMVATWGGNQIWNQLGQLLIGFLVYGIFFYVFHMFVNLKFGMGLSIFLGIFETMQGIIYSNIHIKGIFRFIPFSWVIQWEQNVLEGTVQCSFIFWLTCIMLFFAFCFMLQEWFQNWEGKKNYGE